MQTDIFGNVQNTTPIAKEVEKMIEKHPATIECKHLRARLYLKERIPGFAQLDETMQEQTIDTMYSFLSFDRAFRKFLEEDREAKI